MCRKADLEVCIRKADLQKSRFAERQICRKADLQKSRKADLQKSRFSERQICRKADLQKEKKKIRKLDLYQSRYAEKQICKFEKSRFAGKQIYIHRNADIDLQNSRFVKCYKLNIAIYTCRYRYQMSVQKWPFDNSNYKHWEELIWN